MTQQKAANHLSRLDEAITSLTAVAATSTGDAALRSSNFLATVD
jgi:hypothetical protein